MEAMGVATAIIAVAALCCRAVSPQVLSTRSIAPQVSRQFPVAPLMLIIYNPVMS